MPYVTYQDGGAETIGEWPYAWDASDDEPPLRREST